MGLFAPSASIAVYVEDVAAALAWYEEKLGFQVRSDHSRDPFPHATAAPAGASWQLIFLDPGAHGEELADRFRAEIGFSPHLMLACADLEATCGELRTRGVEITGWPAERFGMIQAHFRDLTGNVITLVDLGGMAQLRDLGSR